MIRDHEFNSVWYGRRAGLVTDVRFFDLSESDRARLLVDYAWVEYRAPLTNGIETLAPSRCGFAFVDVQVEFRISLRRIPTPPCVDDLSIISGEDQFVVPAIQDIKPFVHERYALLSEVDAEKLQQRYWMWAQRLAAADPRYCLTVGLPSSVQGWFFAHPTNRGLNLTLAAMHRDATISGAALYAHCLRAYADRGATVGYAGFSVTNLDVHNIYAWLGARFIPPTAVWIWQAA